MRHNAECYWIFSHSGPVCGRQRCFTSSEYETNIIPSSKVIQCHWVGMLGFACVLQRVCIVWTRDREGRTLNTVPAVFSWVGFHLQASKTPLHFLSHTLHLYLKMKTSKCVTGLSIIGQVKLIHRAFYYRMEYDTKSCDDFIKKTAHTYAHALTQRTKRPGCTSLLGHESISRGLRHRSDSSAAYFKIISMFTNTVHFVHETHFTIMHFEKSKKYIYSSCICIKKRMYSHTQPSIPPDMFELHTGPTWKPD